MLIFYYYYYYFFFLPLFRRRPSLSLLDREKILGRMLPQLVLCTRGGWLCGERKSDGQAEQMFVTVQEFMPDKVPSLGASAKTKPHLVRETAAERCARELRRHGGRALLPRQRVAEREGALFLRPPPPFQRAKMLLERERDVHMPT